MTVAGTEPLSVTRNLRMKSPPWVGVPVREPLRKVRPPGRVAGVTPSESTTPSNSKVMAPLGVPWILRPELYDVPTVPVDVGQPTPNESVTVILQLGAVAV